jgi:multidrug efflux pump subunit AcrB
MQVTTPEGSSYEYTDNFILELSKLVEDSIPEKEFNLTVTSPGFSGSGAANTGFLRIRLSEPSERKTSQAQVAEKLTKITKSYTEGRVFVIQQPTISVTRRGGLPVNYIIQAPNFEKLREKLPLFMEEISQDPTFTATDANLKFNKPEINITIDREKSRNLGVSILGCCSDTAICT